MDRAPESGALRHFQEEQVLWSVASAVGGWRECRPYEASPRRKTAAEGFNTGGMGKAVWCSAVTRAWPAGDQRPTAGWQRKLEARGYLCMLFQVIDALRNLIFIDNLFLRPTLALLIDLLALGFLSSWSTIVAPRSCCSKGRPVKNDTNSG